MHVQILVLGPFEVCRDGGAVAVGGAAVRAVLGALVVSANHSVSVGRLTEVVWGSSPPATAANALQSLVSRVRRLVGHEAVVFADNAYLLRAACDDVDACRFERLVEEALDSADRDPAAAREASRRALALWRGDPYGELSSIEPFHVEALRLAELRRLAVEIELRAGIALGEEPRTIPLLRTALAEDPYREHLWEWLVEALLHEGRRVDAVEALDAYERILGEVGLRASEVMGRLRGRVAASGHEPGGGGPPGGRIMRVSQGT